MLLRRNYEDRKTLLRHCGKAKRAKAMMEVLQSIQFFGHGASTNDVQLPRMERGIIDRVR